MSQKTSEKVGRYTLLPFISWGLGTRVCVSIAIMRLMMQLSTLQGPHNEKGHTIGANIGAIPRYSHSKTPKFMDLATHIHFFVHSQVFEWLNHVS